MSITESVMEMVYILSELWISRHFCCRVMSPPSIPCSIQFLSHNTGDNQYLLLRSAAHPSSLNLCNTGRHAWQIHQNNNYPVLMNYFIFYCSLWMIWETSTQVLNSSGMYLNQIDYRMCLLHNNLKASILTVLSVVIWVHPLGSIEVSAVRSNYLFWAQKPAVINNFKLQFAVITKIQIYSL